MRFISRPHAFQWGGALALAIALATLPSAPALARGGQDPQLDHAELWRAGEYRKALEKLDADIDEIVASSGRVPVTWMLDRSRIHFDLGMVDEAIDDMETIEVSLREPTYTVRLALLYRYRGRMDDYYRMLERATQLADRSFGFGAYNENVVALGRLAELLGESPRRILTEIYDSFLREGSRYTPGIIAAADLAWRKADYTLAAEYYERVLAIEEDHMEALAGLAEAYWKSNDERVEETVERILEINPRHPRARAIQVEMLLDRGVTDQARRLILAQLGLNPNSTRFRSLYCAALFLDDDDALRERIQNDVLEFNPVCSELFRTMGRIASRHYRFKEAAEFQARAVELDPDDHDARALLAFDLLRLGQDEAGRAELETAFEGDPYNVQAYNMLQLLDKVQAFTTVERGPFRIQLPPLYADVLSAEALEMLDEAIALYEEKYQIDLEKPVYVQLFDDHDDFMVRSVGLGGSVGYMGICFGRLVTMDSPSARPRWSMNWESVLWHEFVHVVTLQKTGNRMPRWLSEGVSVYEETERDPAWGQRIDPQYKALLAGDEELPGLSDLEAYFTQARSAVHLMFGYFAAGEFVKFYVDEYGFDALRVSLDSIGEGVKAEPALAEASGVPLAEVDASFRAYLTRRLAVLDNLPRVDMSDATTVDVMDVSTSVTLADRGWGGDSVFTGAMNEALQALDEERWDDAEAALERAQEAFPDYMGADSPLRQLIALYLRLGKRDELKDALRRQLDLSPIDFTAFRRLVTLQRDAGEWEAVARTAERALGVDPFDVGMRLTQLDALTHEGHDALALDELAYLTTLDRSHATDYRLQRVDILIKTRDWARARQEAVALLEDVPHYWEAQKRLLQIAERGGQEVDREN